MNGMRMLTRAPPPHRLTTEKRSEKQATPDCRARVRTQGPMDLMAAAAVMRVHADRLTGTRPAAHASYKS
jgi:hypothetical protein